MENFFESAKKNEFCDKLTLVFLIKLPEFGIIVKNSNKRNPYDKKEN
jgi:hypothetical protein